MTITIVHSNRYSQWVFDPEHPTQGRRFDKGFDAIVMALEEEQRRYRVIEPEPVTEADLLRIHTPDYVRQVQAGRSDEWAGLRPDLGSLAGLFVGGTLTALNSIREQDWLGVNLPGAKHHAMAEYSSGFCVFADFAIAANILSEEGKRVAILDIDAHHGDGTEVLTEHDDNVLTFSIHEAGIFPGTGLKDNPTHLVFNEPLSAYSGGSALTNGVDRFIEVASRFRPDFVFIAGGADGHWFDPLSSLLYSLDDYEEAMWRVRESFRGTPILFGGAGGYQPDGGTPLSWASMIRGLAR
jgi:acetoin utilization protein AcuC